MATMAPADAASASAPAPAPVPADAPADAPAATSTAQHIDPWNVRGEIGEDGTAKAIDYTKLVAEWGARLIDDALLERFERVTGHRPHRFMRRRIILSHRDLEAILDRHERGEPFFLYTGRGPSSDSMHVGHMQVFDFCKWIQEVFDVPIVIELTDDEKYLVSEKIHDPAESIGYSRLNAKDIIAVGFDPAKTFIFSDYQFMGGAFYRNVTRFAKCVTYNTAKSVFGFNDSNNIGKIHFTSIQGATSFASSFPHIFGEDEKVTSQIPCLIPCAIDQDPYFRLTRDVAARLHYAKPSLIHSRFLDALQGPGSKMSASDDTSAIFMKDTQSQIEKKIKKHAFSGGQETTEQQRELGGNPDVDVSYQWLRFFMEDDSELARIEQEYRSGQLLTGELKAICIRHLKEYVGAFQVRRAAVTDEVVDLFMSPRPLKWGGGRLRAVGAGAAEGAAAARVVPEMQTQEGKDGGDGGQDGTQGEAGADNKISKNQLKKLEKAKMVEAKKAAKAKEKTAA